MTSIKVGLLGYGLAGSVFHSPLIQSCPNMTLEAIGSRSFATKQLPEGVRAGTCEEVIADSEIDLIVIATPNISHSSLARAALMAGKHVVIDKPFAIRVSDAEELISLAAFQGRLISVFQNRRWDGGFLTVQKAMSEGLLGEVSYAEFHYDRFRPDVGTRWREEQAPGAGILYDLGPHLIDQAYCLFGMPNAVTCDVLAQRDGAKVADYFHMILDYGMMRVVLHASSLMANTGPRIAVYGDKNSIAHYGLDNQEDDLKAGKVPGDSHWGVSQADRTVLLTTDGSEQILEPMLGSYERYYNGIAQAILNNAPPPVLASEARDTMSILEGAVISGIERRTVGLL